MVEFSNLIRPAMIIGGTFIVGLLALGAWFFFKSKGSKFKFLLYSRDGKSTTVIEAVVKIDSENKSKKTFVFKDHAGELMIRAPTLFMNGKPFREITYADDGDLAYIEGKEVDRTLYLKKALMPEEKQITLFRMKENNKRYENPIDKYQAILMGAMLIVVLLLVVGIIYVTTTYVKNIKVVTELAKDNLKTTSALSSIADIFKSISEQQVTITAMLTNNSNILRQIG